MSTKKDHLSYIKEKGEFRVDCSHEIFHPAEIKVLEKYGHWFHALTTSILEPISEGQKEFIRVANHEITPITPAEKAWHKYLARKVIEAKAGDSLKIQYHVEVDPFYNREMARQEKRIMYGEMKKNHNRL
jgi:uncharacterized protein YifE (UPF0438 family)